MNEHVRDAAAPTGLHPHGALATVAAANKATIKAAVLVGAPESMLLVSNTRHPAGRSPRSRSIEEQQYGSHRSARCDDGVCAWLPARCRRPVRYGPIVPFDLAERIASEDHATLWAKTIALAARNGVEDLHAAGAFTDQQAPALNRRLRCHAYEVLIALRRMDSRRDDDPFSACLIDLIDDWEEDPLCAAVGSAITDAVREFADAEGIHAETTARLERAALDGALGVVDLYYRVDQPEARRQLAFLIISIPGYWEQPQVSPSFKTMLEDRSVPPRAGRAR